MFGFKGLFGLNVCLLGEADFLEIVDGVKKLDMRSYKECVVNLIVEITDIQRQISSFTYKKRLTGDIWSKLAEEFGYPDKSSIKNHLATIRLLPVGSLSEEDKKLIEKVAILEEENRTIWCNGARNDFGYIGNKIVERLIKYNAEGILHERLELFESLYDQPVHGSSDAVLGTPIELLLSPEQSKFKYGCYNPSYANKALNNYLQSYSVASQELALNLLRELEVLGSLDRYRRENEDNMLRTKNRVVSDLDRAMRVFSLENVCKTLELEYEPTNLEVYYTSKALAEKGLLGFTTEVSVFNITNELKLKANGNANSLASIDKESIFYKVAQLVEYDKQSKLEGSVR